ncbi:MAG: esterase-like activity of phytase family protein, partial [Microcystaceae cyanobacterium]
MIKVLAWCTNFVLLIALMGCGNLDTVNAEERLFLDISLDFLGEYTLPKQTFQDTKVGGFSGITYDRQRDRFYVITDDRQQPRFYTLKLDLNAQGETVTPKITIENVTLLKDELGEVLASQKFDTEGITLTPRSTVFIISEGDIKNGVFPLIGEFDLQNGQLQQKLRLPDRFLPSSNPQMPSQGIQNNSGLESLAVAATSILKDDPFRLFTAVENSLNQDIDLEKRPKSAPLRFLHYLINPIGEPVLIGENLYILDAIAPGTLFSGLSDITTLEKEGYFISLERNLGLAGFGIKLFQV